MGENTETGRQPKPSERGSIFKEGSRRWSIWEEGAQANRMIRIWQGQQRKEWELCSMSTCSIANTKLQKTLACAFLYPLFCPSLEKEGVFCCRSGSLAMATALQLTEAKGYRVMLVAFRPEAEGWWGAWITPDTWLTSSLQLVPSQIFKGVLQHYRFTHLPLPVPQGWTEMLLPPSWGIARWVVPLHHSTSAMAQGDRKKCKVPK